MTEKHYCLHEDVIFGNGKPGLVRDVQAVKLALYGDDQNHIRGMISKQEEIRDFVYSVKPYLKPKLLICMYGLCVAACLKVLGVDRIADIIEKFIR